MSSEGPFKYTPDYEVVRRDETVAYVEVKPRDELNRPSVQQRLTDAKAGLALLGHPFYVWDERIYFRRVRHDTLKMLLPWRGRMTAQECREARALVAQAQPRKLSELRRVTRSQSLLMLWVANEIVGIDIDEPFTINAPVYIAPAEMRHAKIFA
jgi:hypothetical protein